jgi:hypothetical protein
MQNIVFWVVAPCGSSSIGGTSLLGRPVCSTCYIVIPCFPPALMMEAKRSSEMSENTGTTRCYNPEDDILHSHRRENLKSYNLRNIYISCNIPIENLEVPPFGYTHIYFRGQISRIAHFCSFSTDSYGSRFQKIIRRPIVCLCLCGVGRG